MTLADTTFPLDDPFWVLATQNPVEQEGVYALPEAQLDRFSMMLRVGYPGAAHEEVRCSGARPSTTTIERRVSPADVARLRDFIRDTVYVDDKILIDYIVRLGRATRNPPDGRPRRSDGDAARSAISPRSYQHVLALSRVTAFLHGRAYVLPADVKEIFLRRDAASHRAQPCARRPESVDADDPARQLLPAVPIP